MSDREAALLTAKAPILGAVKTRLAASIGDEAALALYECLLADAAEALADCRAQGVVCYAPEDAEMRMRALLGSSFRYLPQRGQTLGDRMRSAFVDVFHAAAGDAFDRAVLIGSDLPEMSPHILNEALDALDDHDAVLAPSGDGGYCLIGFRKTTFLPQGFADIDWSTSAVLQQTQERLAAHGRRFRLLPTLPDIDNIADLRDLFARRTNDQSVARRTMSLLQSPSMRRTLAKTT